MPNQILRLYEVNYLRFFLLSFFISRFYILLIPHYRPFLLVCDYFI